MRTLVIDTAAEALSLALFDDGEMLAHTHVMAGRGHAERLLPAIAALPGGGKADQIAVDVGPGSFTGVRIGLAAARALAFAWNIPLTGYSALALIAAIVRRNHAPTAPFPVAITGGHGELFWQIFSIENNGSATPLVSTPVATLANIILDPVIFGSGAKALVEARGHGTATDIAADSAHYLLLDQYSQSLPPAPLYGRGADAKPMSGLAMS